jgi:hypothetical protein
MRITLLLFCTLSTVLFSCQKEASFESSGSIGNTGGSGSGGTTTGTLLVKSVGVTGTDSTVTTYTYDNKQRQNTMIMDATGSMPMHQYRKLEYDSIGRIAKIIQAIGQNGATPDTSIDIIHYPSATAMEMDYDVNNLTMNMYGISMTTSDSTLFVYTNGKITSTVSYMNNSMLGTGYFQSTRNDFIYDAASRVSTIKLNGTTAPGAPLSSMGDEVYTYGTSFDATWLPASVAQKYWIGGLPNASNEAVTQIKIINSPSAANGTIITNTYTMGANNRPSSAVTVQTLAGQPTVTTNLKFYYQ